MKPSVATRHSHRAQRGVATVFVTVILLLAVALIALYTNRGAIMQARLAANSIRGVQALAAANAGVDKAIAYLKNGGALGSAIPTGTLINGSGTSSYYQVVLALAGSTPPNCPATHSGTLTTSSPATATTLLMIVSCGWSDDDSSVQRILQGAGVTPVIAGSVTTPLVTRGTTNLLTGGASVLNYFNDLTVWSGGPILGQSNTGKTFIRDIATDPSPTSSTYRNTGNSPACNNPPTGYVCSTQGSTIGADTVTGDSSLSNLTTDQFFERFFSLTPAAYRNTIAASTSGLVVDLTGTLTAANYTNFSTSINSITTATQQVIWVEGNTSLPGNVGSQTAPVILIVNGDLALGSNSVVNGLIYVTGAITGNGSPTIYGALVGAGTATANGNPKIIYDPAVLNQLNGLGVIAKLQGSWHDW